MNPGNHPYTTCEMFQSHAGRLQATLEPHEIDPRFSCSDYVPSDIERSQAAEVLQEDAEKLERCNEGVALLKGMLEMLEEKQGVLEMNVRTCRSVLAAQRRVPNEIWETIFTILCNSLHDYSLNVNFDHEWGARDVLETPPLILSQVCSRWRAIAKGLPHLWSSVSVAFGKLPYDITVPLDLYLTNSKKCPLSIRIIRELRSGYRPPLNKDAVVAWRHLVRQFSRCGTLTFLATHFDFPAVRGLSFPQLRIFREEALYYGSSRYEMYWIWQAIWQAPTLTTVFLCSFNDDFAPSSRLRSLHISAVCEDSVIPLLIFLPSCTCLEILSIYAFVDGCKRHPEILEQEVPSLRKLVFGAKTGFSEANGAVLATLLSSLCLPSLVSLELRAAEGWPQSLLTLARRSPLIEHLDLYLPCSTQRDDLIDALNFDLTPLFWSLPNLMDLELHIARNDSRSEPTSREIELPLFGDEIFSKMLSSLRTKPDYSLLLPKLTRVSLSLFPLSLGPETIDQVLDLVSERHSISRPFMKFHVFRNPKRSSLQRGAEIEKAGLDPALRKKASEFGKRVGGRIVVGDFDDEEITQRNWNLYEV
ncbi:hypothetical protein AAF712_006328 [Marasmius tenuissimus]|uniref:F-box domain-containing protein n=1 Tax=Marasmius tenuissimus TaxID=585030 RepID=A0ABR3A126_9AGAR